MPNFYVIYHISRNISISGLGGNIAISGCRSLSQSFGDTFFDVAVVEELDFVTYNYNNYNNTYYGPLF